MGNWSVKSSEKMALLRSLKVHHGTEIFQMGLRTNSPVHTWKEYMYLQTC